MSVHLTIYLQAMRTSYELATKIYTLHSGGRSLHNQIFPYVVNDEVAETVFSVVIYLLSRELCQTVRQQTFQSSRASSQSKNTFPSSSKMRWKLGQQILFSRLQSSERTDHWQVLAVSPGPIRFFVLHCLRTLFPPPIIFR